jgi:hypothetical protein
MAWLFISGCAGQLSAPGGGGMLNRSAGRPRAAAPLFTVTDSGS